MMTTVMERHMADGNEGVPFMEPEQLRQLVREGTSLSIVDVRTPAEFLAGHVEGAVNIPADQLATRHAELDASKPIVTVCNHGGSRSRNAAEQLRTLGYDRTLPLRGGTHGWLAQEVGGEEKSAE
jgi:hydroxyacylglutathione hydrolase